MLRTVHDLLKEFQITVELRILIGLGVQHFKDTVPILIDGILDRLCLLFQNAHIAVHKLLAQLRQLRNLLIGLRHPDDGVHLSHHVFQFCIHDVGLAVLVDIQHIQRTGEDGQLLTAKEITDRLIVLAKIHQIVLLVKYGLKEFQRCLNLHQCGKPLLALVQNFFSGIGVILIFGFQPLDLGDSILAVVLEVLHDGIFVIGRGCHLEQLLHHSADGLFLIFRHTNTYFRQQLIHKLLLRDVADDFLFGTVVQIDALSVDRKRQVSTLKEPCHQPMNVIFHKAIGCFHKAILNGFHRSLHVHPGIACHELQYIIQCVNIGLSGISQ